MNVSLSKSEVKGQIVAPTSKSYTIRGLMCAALARGESEIISPLISDDTLAAANVLSNLGIGIERQKGLWRVAGGTFSNKGIDLYCGESATTFRFMIAICALIPGQHHLIPGPSLAGRPVRHLLEALAQAGVNCRQETNASVIVSGGDFRGGEVALPGDITSQYVSALLLVAPLAREKVTIRLTTPLKSKPYVMMTRECLEKFGIRIKVSHDYREFRASRQNYHPTSYRVEGDWSSAAYLVALGAVLGETEVSGVNPESLQADKAILKLLKGMGASIATNKDSISLKQSRIRAIKTDLNDSIDLLPTMAVLAAVADGQSEFTGIARARLKESNRVAAVREGLQRMGISVIEEPSRLLITGGKPKGAVIDSHDDHRIAMAFSILGALSGDTIIEKAESVSKTFPEFWQTLKHAGVRMKINDG